ncbi:DNA-deoxyinosine glycosylase [Campylobacter sp. TTU_617]|uniref:DNA-deoxyinosine glycosylase n=1 Tax=Campylobacter sp. TTU_617 TaxID=2768148 RepID=UPI001906B7F2|nr:DNA-deoxyinosine glycosylase [Campylobacter sp. TTU_617]MBK1971629.1 DNA-deoxyinosine glycosylase [Campylobacter sp. TTU_617]
MNDIITHPLEPFFDKNSKILILGSFPSIKSRLSGFYYQHPRNHFWKILEKLYQVKLLNNIETQKKFLKMHHIALWDVLQSCKIKNSDDKSISFVKMNDLSQILNKAKIEKIAITGQKAFTLFKKYQESFIKETYPNIRILTLPSSSPANLNFSFEQLVHKYQVILD